jgi:hypothetical protein
MSTSQIGAEKRRNVTDTKVVEAPTVSEARARATAKPGPTNDDTGADGLPAAFEFDLDYTDRRGRVWSGHFQAHVLGIQEKITVGLTRANMSGGLAPEALDIQTFNLLEMQAHLSVALDDAPKWARNMSKIRDVNVLHAVYKEVASYEAKFHGADAGDVGETAGADES